MVEHSSKLLAREKETTTIVVVVVVAVAVAVAAAAAAVVAVIVVVMVVVMVVVIVFVFIVVVVVVVIVIVVVCLYVPFLFACHTNSMLLLKFRRPSSVGESSTCHVQCFVHPCACFNTPASSAVLPV